MKEETKNIFQRFVHDNYSLDDEKQVASSFKQEKEADLRELLQGDWKESLKATTTPKDLKHILHRIHFILNSNQELRKDNWSKKLLSVYSRIAAILLLPLAIWAVFNYAGFSFGSNQSATAEIHAPQNARVSFQLPDGSKGWLKNGSTLEYGIGFHNRHVKLDGEGYFDVVHDPEQPFVVKGPYSEIRVLGTTFNAAMWPNELVTEVVLESGTVQFSYEGQDQAITLTPGQKLIFNRKEDMVAVEEVNTLVSCAWKDGLLMFRGDNLIEVGKQIGRWFNVDVEVVGENAKDYKIRATFKDENLEEVLRMLKLSSGIDYKIIDGKKLEDGSYTRKKVILSTMNKT